jgi:hypothetical protein
LASCSSRCILAIESACCAATKNPFIPTKQAINVSDKPIGIKFPNATLPLAALPAAATAGAPPFYGQSFPETLRLFLNSQLLQKLYSGELSRYSSTSDKNGAPTEAANVMKRS